MTSTSEDAARPWFPYMAFARNQAVASAHSLTQSGMPAADVALFDDLRIDLDFAGARALPRLRESIAAHVGVGADAVLLALGASGAMHQLALVLFRPGVRVVTEIPSYEPLRALPRRAGAEVREVVRSIDDGWRIDVAQVARALEGSRKGHIFITTPHNPSGATTDANTLRELAELAARHNGYLISNEIYLEFAPPERAVRAVHLAPNAISIGSLTKAYGLGPLRIGWIALGSLPAQRRAEFEDSLYLDYVDAPTTTLNAGQRAFECLPSLRAPIEKIERESKPVFVDWLARARGVRATLPAMGLIAFAHLEGVDDTLALQRFLASEHGVAVTPGEYFGSPGYVRLGFGTPRTQLAEALARFERGLAAFRS